MSRPWPETVEHHRTLLRRRKFPMAAENVPPTGQAGLWFEDAMHNVSGPTARNVARQIARLCGDDSQVTVPWRSLTDAVGRTDRAGRTRAYAEAGVGRLVEAGWLTVETTGRGAAARTTFYLQPGERVLWWAERSPLAAVA